MNDVISDGVRVLDQQMVDLWTQYGTTGPHEEQPFVPTAERIQQFERWLTTFRSQLRRTPATRPLDSATLHHLSELERALRFRLEDDQAFPFRYIWSATSNLNDLLWMDQRPLPQRLAVIERLLGQMDALLQAVLARSGRARPDAIKQVDAHLTGLLRAIRTIETQHENGPSSLHQRIAQVYSHVEDVQRQMENISVVQDPIQPQPYADRLAMIWAIDVSELLQWADHEVERCHERLHAMAHELDPKRSPFELLDQELGSCDHPNQLFPLMRDYVATARRASRDHIHLPKDETCEVWPVSEQAKDSFPWGGYNGPNPLSNTRRGAVFVNQHNYRDVTLGWLQMMAIHECYPGHHAHRVKTIAAQLPTSFKLTHIMAPGGPLSEGIAHRSEALFQNIFDNAAFPLFVAYRRLHIAVRVKSELLLHYFGRDIDTNVQLYQDYLGFSDPVARGQLRFQELWPGYMVIYCYGQKQIEALQNEIQWPQAAFTEFIFSVGNVGIESLKTLIHDPQAHDAIRQCHQDQSR